MQKQKSMTINTRNENMEKDGAAKVRDSVWDGNLLAAYQMPSCSVMPTCRSGQWAHAVVVDDANMAKSRCFESNIDVREYPLGISCHRVPDFHYRLNHPSLVLGKKERLGSSFQGVRVDYSPAVGRKTLTKSS